MSAGVFVPSSSTLPDTDLIGVSIPIPITRERSLDRESVSDISEASSGSLKRSADEDVDMGSGRKKMRESTLANESERMGMEPDEASQAGPYENGSEDIDRVNANGKEKERDYEQPIASTSGQMRETEELPPPVDGQALAEDLAQELQCGCCAELVYKPVVVMPCEHFFCGSCCQLWIQNGGTNCPACRAQSTSVVPSRHIQAMVDVLLRAAPHKQRTIRERQQADEIYPTSKAFRIPPPRTPSPAPSIPSLTEFVRPCPHCSAHNQHGWSCPNPVLEGAWRIDDGAPPGHGFCANCETLLALTAPSTSRCDFCLSAFCGLQVPGRCQAISLNSQHPHGFSDVGDLIQSAEIYEAFDGNAVEVEMMLDYMTNHELSPRTVYRQIVAYYQSRPNKFAPLIEMDLFTDIHGVPAPPYYPSRSSSRASASSSSSANEDTRHIHNPPAPDANRQRICRLCAAEVLLYGVKDWWVRERRKAVKDGKLPERKDCEHGRDCEDVDDPAHAKEFNHIMISPGEEELYRNPSPVTSSSSSSSSRGGSSSSSTPVNNSANGSSRSSSSGSVPNSHPSSSANSNQSSPRRQASAPNGPLTNLPSLAELGIPPLPVAGPFGFGPMGMNGNSNAIPQFLLGRNGTNASSDSIHGFQPFLGMNRPGLVSHQSQDGIVPTPSSSQSQSAVEAVLQAVSGYESDGSNNVSPQSSIQGHVQAEQSFNAQPVPVPPPTSSCASDLAQAMERERQRERGRSELEARCVASFAQVLLSTEEAEEDLRNIRNAQALAAQSSLDANNISSLGHLEQLDPMNSPWGPVAPLGYSRMQLQPMDGTLDMRSAMPSSSSYSANQPQSYTPQF